MAGIDKIYGTQEQLVELRGWLEMNNPEALDYVAPVEREFPHIEGTGIRSISNFPEKIDVWLLDNCPIEFVTNRIKEQYGLDEDMVSR